MYFTDEFLSSSQSSINQPPDDNFKFYRLKITNKAWQTILMKYHTIIGKDVSKFVVCCSRDWPFKGYHPLPLEEEGNLLKGDKVYCNRHTFKASGILLSPPSDRRSIRHAVYNMLSVPKQVN